MSAPARPGKLMVSTISLREHGAAAMLLTPFLAAVILLRRVYWPEWLALAAMAGAFAIKDPLIVLARQRFIWKHEHPETRLARRDTAALGLFLLICGLALALVRGWTPWIPLILGAGVSTALAVAVNVQNRQRSEWFQVAGAMALSATCLVACLAALNYIPDWCWLLWALCSLQTIAGILVIHARLEARVSARNPAPASHSGRRAAYFSQIVLIAAAVVVIILQRFWIAAAMILAVVCYVIELRRQKDVRSLQLPLRTIGLQSLALSVIYTSIVVIGLWHG